MAEKIKSGLVLEGGAMRGMFTAGVLDVMMENNITFDGAIGVSAGAVFGCNFKSLQIGRAIRYNKKYCSDKRYVSWSSWLKTGDVYGVDFCYNELPFKLDLWDQETFKNNPMDFYVTCTDVVTGQPVYHLCNEGAGEDIQWMRASASMPLLSRIVEIGDNKLLDGGISDAVPLKYFESIGYNKNVVVLTQPIDYVKKKNPFVPLAHIMLRKYPAMIKTFAERQIGYNATTAYVREKEEAGEVFVIRPSKALEIGGIEKNPDELERVYQIGRNTAMECLDELKKYLQ